MCSAARLGGSGRKGAVQLSFPTKLILTENVVHRNVKMLLLFLMQNSKIKVRGADRTIWIVRVRPLHHKKCYVCHSVPSILLLTLSSCTM